MFIGRYQMGDWVPLSVQCRKDTTASDPTAAPVLNIFNFNFSKVVGPRNVPPRTKERTGLFEVEQYIDDSFSAGIHYAHISYTVVGRKYAEIVSFDVMPGGHKDGTYIGLYFYHRPHADYIVGQLDTDVLESRRNPNAPDG